MSNKEISLTYFKGIIPDEELNLIENELHDVGIALRKIDNSGVAMMNAIDLMPMVYFTLGSIVSGVTYDIFKSCIIKAWNSVKDKHINKITPDGKKEIEATFGLTIRLKRNLVVSSIIPKDVPEKEVEDCIDKLFEFAKPYETKSRTFDILNYDVNSKSWSKVDFEKELGKKEKE